MIVEEIKYRVVNESKECTLEKIESARQWVKTEASIVADYLWGKKIEHNYDYNNKDCDLVDELIEVYIEKHWNDEEWEKLIYTCFKKDSGRFICTAADLNKEYVEFSIKVYFNLSALEEVEKERKKEEIKKFRQDIKETRTISSKSRTTFISGGIPSLGKKR